MKKTHDIEQDLQALRQAPNVQRLRADLKQLLYQELQALPQLLQALEPKDRIAVLVKLVPYVLPRVDSVQATEGQHTTYEW